MCMKAQASDHFMNEGCYGVAARVQAVILITDPVLGALSDRQCPFKIFGCNPKRRSFGNQSGLGACSLLNTTTVRVA